MLLRFSILCTILLVIELYAFQAFKTIIKTKWILISYEVISIVALVYIIYSFTQFDRSVGQTKQTLFTMGLLLLVYVPKILVTVVMLGEDIYRIIMGSVNYFINNDGNGDFLASRRKFVSQIGLGLAAVPFLSLIYGMTIGKYNYKVIKQRIFFAGLA